MLSYRRNLSKLLFFIFAGTSFSSAEPILKETRTRVCSGYSECLRLRDTAIAELQAELKTSPVLNEQTGFVSFRDGTPRHVTLAEAFNVCRQYSRHLMTVTELINSQKDFGFRILKPDGVENKDIVQSVTFNEPSSERIQLSYTTVNWHSPAPAYYKELWTDSKTDSREPIALVLGSLLPVKHFLTDQNFAICVK